MPELNINIDEISSITDRLPVGRGYIARLGEAQGKKSRSGSDMVEATWEIQKGPYVGTDAKTFYSLIVKKSPKNGKTYAFGISEMKRLFAAIGKPLPASFGFPLNADAAAKLFATKLKGVSVELAAFEEEDRKGELDDNGNIKKYTRIKVIGPASTLAAIPTESPAPAAATDEYD